MRASSTLHCQSTPVCSRLRSLTPSCRFRRDQSSALDPAIQALAVQRTELQLHGIQPAPMFRRVHQVDTVVQPTGFGRRERGVERVTAVGVQVVATLA